MVFDLKLLDQNNSWNVVITCFIEGKNIDDGENVTCRDDY